MNKLFKYTLKALAVALIVSLGLSISRIFSHEFIPKSDLSYLLFVWSLLITSFIFVGSAIVRFTIWLHNIIVKIGRHLTKVVDKL